MELYQDWRHDTCDGCARCVSRGDPAIRTADGWLVWLGWTTECVPARGPGASLDFDVCRIPAAPFGAVGVER